MAKRKTKKEHIETGAYLMALLKGVKHCQKIIEEEKKQIALMQNVLPSVGEKFASIEIAKAEERKKLAEEINSILLS
tara:strand:- start:61 stop:291 length:231 start_codon:yes stop_codon:yes gene_type:complete